MGDGWETKRNRTPGNKDWVIVKLAHEGTVERILIDTAHFKGNYPDSCLVEGCVIANGEDDKLEKGDVKWTTILPKTKLQADHEHYFEKEIQSRETFTHARLTIFPDGGVSRMRLWGHIRKQA